MVDGFRGKLFIGRRDVEMSLWGCSVRCNEI